MWESGTATRQGQWQRLKGIIGASAVMLCRELRARWSKQSWERLAASWGRPRKQRQTLPQRRVSLPRHKEAWEQITRSSGASGPVPQASFLWPVPPIQWAIIYPVGTIWVWEYLRLGGCQRCPWIRWEIGQFKGIIFQKRSPAIWDMRGQTNHGILNGNRVPLWKPAWGFTLNS